MTHSNFKSDRYIKDTKIQEEMNERVSVSKYT